LVSPPPAGFAAIRRSGEANLCMEFLIIIVLFHRLCLVMVVVFYFASLNEVGIISNK
jgi:hypothetical protein